MRASKFKWSENLIARALSRNVFEQKHLIIVPNCGWTGDECDLLVVTRDLRIIDVEIKISRSDLKADARKNKWYHLWDWRVDKQFGGRRRPREWPRKVWKHYYALPEKIWTPDLADVISPKSGVLLMYERNDNIRMTVKRRAKPCRDAEKIAVEDAVNIARLASLRMWDAYDKLRRK